MTQVSENDRRERAHACIDRLHEALLAHDMESFADQWAKDGSMSFPFAPPGWPALAGREEVRSYLSGYTERIDIQGISHQQRHETTDPDTLIVEWGVTGKVLANDGPYDVDYVAFVTIDDDGIRSYRDYWSPLAIGTAMGSVETMVDAFRVEEHK